jgi:uncharacterized phiE125 gp8 family phage protein
MAVKVITPPAVEPITLEEALRHLNLIAENLDEGEEADILRMIKAARQMAEGRLNRSLAPQTLAAGFDVWGEALRLPRPPFIELVGVSYIDSDGAQQTANPLTYAVNEFVEPVTIAANYGYSWPALQPRASAVTVTYRAGYEECPEPIRQWMLLVIASMYDNRATMTAGVTTASIPEEFFSWLLQPYMVYE